MAFFSLRGPYWNFPENNYGQISGVADSGIETFNGNPIKSLAREICQNSIDAHYKEGKPTCVEFIPFEIEPASIPGFRDLEDAIKRSLEFWSVQQSNKAKRFFTSAIEVTKKRKITCLRISDYNTTGLTGSDAELNSPWINLIKSSGSSDKTGSKGGSFGIGKFAVFACSKLRTVFYSTSDCEGLCAYQGVARLTSFRDKKGNITQGVGFFGTDKNAPVPEQISLDPAFRRQKSDYGTDIYILGFNAEDQWKEKMIMSVIDGFLLAIHQGKLAVKIDDVEISDKTLPNLIEMFRGKFDEHADEYYDVLISDEKSAPLFTKQITKPGMEGTLKLRLMIKPKMHRRVAMIRQTGMKIKDKGNISGLIPFAGVLYIEGVNLNNYLRRMENPQHIEWEVDRLDDEERKPEARELLRSFTRFIREMLNEMKNDDSEETLDPSVGAYLSAGQDEVKTDDVRENLSDTIKAIELQQISRKPRHDSLQVLDDDETEIDDENGKVDVNDTPGKGSKDGDNSGGDGDGGGKGDGEGKGDNPTGHRKSVSLISALKCRVFCLDKEKGLYSISFIPKSDAIDAYLDLYMAAESQNYDASIIDAICESQPAIYVDNNRIKGLEFKAGVQVKIVVQLNYYDYCSMEVKAYGNKV